MMSRLSTIPKVCYSEGQLTLTITLILLTLTLTLTLTFEIADLGNGGPSEWLAGTDEYYK